MGVGEHKRDGEEQSGSRSWRGESAQGIEQGGSVRLIGAVSEGARSEAGGQEHASSIHLGADLRSS